MYSNGTPLFVTETTTNQSELLQTTESNNSTEIDPAVPKISDQQELWLQSLLSENEEESAAWQSALR
jgi:hypothetical protein